MSAWTRGILRAGHEDGVTVQAGADAHSYRFVCTATPAANQFRELIYYAQFLGVMDAGQAPTRWFKRDPSKAGNLTPPQHEADFWRAGALPQSAQRPGAQRPGL